MRHLPPPTFTSYQHIVRTQRKTFQIKTKMKMRHLSPTHLHPLLTYRTDQEEDFSDKKKIKMRHLPQHQLSPNPLTPPYYYDLPKLKKEKGLQMIKKMNKIEIGMKRLKTML